MQELEIMFRKREVDFDATDRHIMCYAHIVNLSSGRVIEGATGVDAADHDEDWCSPLPPPPNSPNEQSYADAVARDPIALGRNVVRVIRASGKRREAFNEVIQNGNTRGWFVVGESPKQSTITIKPKELLRDVVTRWDSVYHMLNRLREMRPVRFPTLINSLVINKSTWQAIDHFLALPNYSDLAKYRITPQEWAIMQDLEFILSVRRYMHVSYTLLTWQFYYLYHIRSLTECRK